MMINSNIDRNFEQKQFFILLYSSLVEKEQGLVVLDALIVQYNHMDMPQVIVLGSDYDVLISSFQHSACLNVASNAMHNMLSEDAQ